MAIDINACCVSAEFLPSYETVIILGILDKNNTKKSMIINNLANIINFRTDKRLCESR